VKERRATAYQRCAIYTRKSTEAGLERELNSLEAQRETCSAYIRSQRHRGWLELPQHYDDGGFSGGNLQRPGLQRLLADIEAARIDVVVIYKIDRLTRSLLDFVRLLDTMQRYGVSFVSITQAFDTGDSMGRFPPSFYADLPMPISFAAPADRRSACSNNLRTASSCLGPRARSWSNRGTSTRCSRRTTSGGWSPRAALWGPSL
jgi:hypothetical protein